MDETGVLEPAHRRRNGGLRQARGGRDLRTGDRTRAEDRLEHRLLA